MESEILGDLLRDFFNDNLTLDQKLDLLRDENLCLKSRLFHALCGISDEELLLSSEAEEDELQHDGERRRQRRRHSGGCSSSSWAAGAMTGRGRKTVSVRLVGYKLSRVMDSSNIMTHLK